MNANIFDLTQASLFNKLSFYIDKYGLLHTSLSYLGRYSLRFWVVVGSLVTRQYIRKYFLMHQKVIVNLGGGGNCVEGVLTVDISPRADAYADITKPLPFENCSVDHIFCEEVIEHVSYEMGSKLLKECYRVLKIGGCMRISTPSLEWFASEFLSGADETSINDVFYGHGHRFIYSEKTLVAQCLSAGFIDVKISTYKDRTAQLGYLDTHADRFSHPPEISHYLEAYKFSDNELN